MALPFVDWTSPRAARLGYSAAGFAQAKQFVFTKWCAFAAERQAAAPADLAGACKYASIFMQAVFGGAIRGHFEHQYNFIGGRLVDLGHDAFDVGRMTHPYLHELAYFSVPELQVSLNRCAARAQSWADEFMSLHAP